MNLALEKPRNYWFVGATYDEDQTPRFLAEGIWQNGHDDQYLDVVKSVQVGDRIAIKSAYTRKYDLPFDNRGQTVAVMAIKAIGTVKENLGDGHFLKVDWEPVEPQHEWYFYTNRNTIWQVSAGNWMADALIAFTFDGKEQDIDRFRNAPRWHARFGDSVADKSRFRWIPFYEAVADKLLTFKDRRGELVAGIHAIAARVKGMSNLQDRFADGTKGPLKDICPFTVMSTFNRNLKPVNRKAIAHELALLLGVTEPVPESFEGIPVFDNRNSWFFGFANKRQHDDIDAMWDVFNRAIAFATSDNENTRPTFISSYDNAAPRFGIGWKLTIGLYLSRPWIFPTLEGASRPYIEDVLNIEIGRNGPKNICNGSDYLKVMDRLNALFQDDTCPVHSFPELSVAAWRSDYEEEDDSDTVESDIPEENSGAQVSEPVGQPYTIDDIEAEGCFLDRMELEGLLDRLETKKNLILQGPPGTGKTWLAKRLAYALIGRKDSARVRAVQFHPNLSYEDFIRGWRPEGKGELKLVDGPFMKMIEAALECPGLKHVIVIEEINRGNPAQIFGEMLTLLEDTKRNKGEALTLTCGKKAVFIPENLYVIGTMNVADRSLALVDLALRRRFAFKDLKPVFGDVWKKYWRSTQPRADAQILEKIERNMEELNQVITAETGLGPQFLVGHSYVTPSPRVHIEDTKEWFRQVVETEIGPLLDEYWFDDLERAKSVKKQLLAGFDQ